MVLFQFPIITNSSSTQTKYISTIGHNLPPGNVRVKVVELVVNPTQTAYGNMIWRVDFATGLHMRPRTAVSIPSNVNPTSTTGVFYDNADIPEAPAPTSNTTTIVWRVTQAYVPLISNLLYNLRYGAVNTFPNSILLPALQYVHNDFTGFEFDATLYGQDIQIYINMATDAPSASTSATRLAWLMLTLDIEPL